ncbi:hypothetical protein DFJ58DRAFT_859252 [Suillus subalutaceus]|uniref:uncharacterized protein n=1 Tax=Suillus subalutaceus TaxID=48586 RepID=UPI001B862CE6|nr:uncharacterized protein DFJ58DRAFT_859252 [Suillus subalutaceus]KAG1839625.1 hypothetical protein DFJ58DRAFT_859252 [Suillus subalutaceus]
MTVSINVTQAVGLVCEALLYGVYCVLFIASVVILIKRYRVSNRVIWVANCLLFTTSTAHFALMFNHFYIALENAPFSDFGNETSELMGANLMISVVDVIGDLLLLYRCWLVWGKNFYVIVLPLLTALGGFACILPIPSLLLSIDPTSPVPPTQIVPLTIAGYALPLCTNIMVTGLIAGRLWYISRIPVVDEHGKPVILKTAAGGRPMMLIIESGALYMITQLIFVILVATRNPAEAVLSLAGTQIYGIASTLIIIRVGLGISSEQTMSAMTMTRVEFCSQREDTTGMRSVGTWRNDRSCSSPLAAQSGVEQWSSDRPLDL